MKKAWERVVEYLDTAAPHCSNAGQLINFFMSNDYPLNPWPNRHTIQKVKEYIWDRHNFVKADKHIRLKLDTLDLAQSWGKLRSDGRGDQI